MAMGVCPNCKGSNLDYGSIQANLLDKDGNELLLDSKKENDD